MKVDRVGARRLPILSGPGGLGGSLPIPTPADIGIPWYDVVRDGGLVGDGVTDDGPALQAAIDAATSNGTCSATLFFPPGVYLISSALQDTGAFNGQILFPDVSTSDEQITITFLGAARPPFAIHGPKPDPQCYSIIVSDLTGGTGTAAVFSGGNGTWPTQTNVSIYIENLICLGPDNPSLTFWNLSTCQGGGIHNLLIYNSTWSNGTEPTHSNAYGVKLPQWGQSNYTYVDGLMVAEYYTGLLQGELAECKGLIFGLDVVAVELPFSEHWSIIDGMQQTGCTYGIKVTGENRAIIRIDTEHYTDPPFPTWNVTVYDLDDGSDELYGEVVWFALDGVTQLPDHIFNINGGANTISREVGTSSGSSTVGNAVGPILISDTHSTPLVFADLLQTEDGSDLLYLDP